MADLDPAIRDPHSCDSDDESLSVRFLSAAKKNKRAQDQDMSERSDEIHSSVRRWTKARGDKVTKNRSRPIWHECYASGCVL